MRYTIEVTIDTENRGGELLITASSEDGPAWVREIVLDAVNEEVAKPYAEQAFVIHERAGQDQRDADCEAQHAEY